MPINLKAVISWCLYDWGIAAFPVIITTFVTATYFTSKIATNPIEGTHAWGMAMAIAGILTALLSPPCGAIADYSGYHKKWLGFLTGVLIVSSALLWYAYPSPRYATYTLFWVILGTISLNISMVFYNALLIRIAPTAFVGRISGWGWGLGYFGGLLVLCIAYYGFVSSTPSWLDHANFASVRICGPLVALWTLVFAVPLFIFLPKQQTPAVSITRAVKQGMRSLYHTILSVWQLKTIFLFLLAQLLYTDGLNTLFAFGGIYAAGTFHLTLSDVLLFGILMNASAGIGSILFAWIDDWIGAKTTILMSLIFLTILGVGIVLTHDVKTFWALSAGLSLFVGPVQSSSRSLMTQLVPKEKVTEMFGFYILSGKVTTFLGPWLLGLMTLHFDSQRVGMSSIFIFFILGAFVLLFVPSETRFR